MKYITLLSLCGLLITTIGDCCRNGDIMLVGGQDSGEGRLEYCSSGVWGTVCNDNWNFSNTVVACRQLGINETSESAVSNVYFAGAAASQPVHIRNVVCDGSEDGLDDCMFQDGSGCGHDRDVGIICALAESECIDDDVRLVGGPSLDEGRIEFCVGGRWGTICNDNWDVNDVIVACRQQNFEAFDDELRAIDLTVPGVDVASRPIVLSGIECNGTENRLSDCTFLPSIHQCSHAQDVGIRCKCLEGRVRLETKSNFPLEFPERKNFGRAEYCLNGEWKIFCSAIFDDAEAIVICRQLGYDSIDRFLPIIQNPFFFAKEPLTERLPTGESLFSLSIKNKFNCIGQELTLGDCEIDPRIITERQCGDNGVGLECPINVKCKTGDIRLQSGLISPQLGRVEICVNEVWGAVVCNSSWDDADAAVACRQLGYQGMSRAYPRRHFEPRNFDLQSTLSGLMCTGQESSLVNCPNDEGLISMCDAGIDDAGLICGTTTNKCSEEGLIVTPLSMMTENADQSFMISDFGTCALYSGQFSLCNDYINSSSFVFTSARAVQSFEELFFLAEEILFRETNDSLVCQELVSRIVCNYFLAPCGNITQGVHLPISICKEVCECVRDSCTDVWTEVQQLIEKMNIEPIMCNNTAEHYQGLSACCSNFDIKLQDTRLPSAYSIIADVVEVNGSSNTGRCSSALSAGSRLNCKKPKSSILFDGFIPILNFSLSMMWAKELFMLRSSNASELFIELQLSEEVTLSRVDVIMFNCPEWGIGVQNIQILSLEKNKLLSSLSSSTTTSCDSLVTFQLPLASFSDSGVQLQFNLSASSQTLSVAELRLFLNGICPQINIEGSRINSALIASLSVVALATLVLVIILSVIIIVSIKQKSSKKTEESHVYEEIAHCGIAMLNIVANECTDAEKGIDDGYEKVECHDEAENSLTLQSPVTNASAHEYERVDEVLIYDVSRSQNYDQNHIELLTRRNSRTRVDSPNIYEQVGDESLLYVSLPQVINASSGRLGVNEQVPTVSVQEVTPTANQTHDTDSSSIDEESSPQHYERVPNVDIPQILNLARESDLIYEHAPRVNVSSLLSNSIATGQMYEQVPMANISQILTLHCATNRSVLHLAKMSPIYESAPNVDIAQIMELSNNASF